MPPALERLMATIPSGTLGRERDPGPENLRLTSPTDGTAG
jgi:hypothetical protein